MRKIAEQEYEAFFWFISSFFAWVPRSPILTIKLDDQRPNVGVVRLLQFWLLLLLLGLPFLRWATDEILIYRVRKSHQFFSVYFQLNNFLVAQL
jgi:hypothetical protein